MKTKIVILGMILILGACQQAYQDQVSTDGAEELSCNMEQDGGENMDIRSELWWCAELEERAEFQALEDKYIEEFGPLPIVGIRNDLTFGEFEDAVNRAVETGNREYALDQFGVEDATHWSQTERFQKLETRYIEHFDNRDGFGIIWAIDAPTEIVRVSMDVLEELVERSIAENHDHWRDFIRERCRRCD